MRPHFAELQTPLELFGGSLLWLSKFAKTKQGSRRGAKTALISRQLDAKMFTSEGIANCERLQHFSHVYSHGRPLRPQMRHGRNTHRAFISRRGCPSSLRSATHRRVVTKQTTALATSWVYSTGLLQMGMFARQRT